MIWLFGSFSIKDMQKKNVDAARDYISARVKQEADLKEFPHMGDYIMPIHVVTNRVFPSEAEAIKYGENLDGWRRNYNIAIPFFRSKGDKEQKLKERIQAAEEKLKNYEQSHGIQSFKAAYISCPKCGSKINKQYIPKDRCPLCKEDLRSATTKETVKRYQTKIKELNALLKEKEEKNREVRYLIMFEEYVG